MKNLYFLIPLIFNFLPNISLAQDNDYCAMSYVTIEEEHSKILSSCSSSGNGGKTIKFDFGISNGSGVTAFARSDERVLFNYVKHEISHWLLGGGHPYGNGTNDRVASLLSGSLSRSMSVNAVERDRLGWGTIVEITSNLSNVTLGDFLETGIAYKYEAVKSSRNDVHFYFENHQNINIYDDATLDATDKGIFILRTGSIFYNTKMRYLTSDGDWDWENTTPYWAASIWDNDPNDGIDSLGVF